MLAQQEGIPGADDTIQFIDDEGLTEFVNQSSLLSEKAKRQLSKPIVPVILNERGKAKGNVIGIKVEDNTATKYVVKGFDGKFHVVREEFSDMLFNHDYDCYGLPASDFETGYCGKTLYIKQAFQTVDCLDNEVEVIYIFFGAHNEKTIDCEGKMYELAEPCLQTGGKYKAK